MLSTKRVGVGISGGPDSLVLSKLLHEWCKDRGIKVVGITIDHNLRKEAQEEVKFVKKWCLENDIDVEEVCLPWTLDEQKNRVMENARRKRFDAFKEVCLRRDIK
jgi:tRNA(Ile)-lysidine synthase